MSTLIHFDQIEQKDWLTDSGSLRSFYGALQKGTGSLAERHWSILGADVFTLHLVNEQLGYRHGDSVLRWIALLLKEETGASVYRITGSRFAAVLTSGDYDAHERIAQNFRQRLLKEGEKQNLPMPPARIALVHFQQNIPLVTAHVWQNLDETFAQAKENGAYYARMQATPLGTGDLAVYRQIDSMLKGMLTLAGSVDIMAQLAFTDPVTQLPNQLAVERQIESLLSSAVALHKPLCMLMMDGDNLRRYNEISYAEGDEMLKRLSRTILSAVRTSDYVARWRVGDEFVVLLPMTALDGGLVVAEKIRATVEAESHGWRLPVTISIGVACFPEHGSSIPGLVEHAEKGLHQAKMLGKNRVIIAAKSEARGEAANEASDRRTHGE